MSDNSDEHIIWEDAEDDEMDGDYRPPPDDYDEDEFDFDDDVDDVEHDGELQYISFAPDDDEEGDEDEEEEEEEVEEEDDQTYGRTLGVESPSPSALLAALMGAMGGGTRQGLSFLEIERLLGRAQRQDNTSWWEAQVDPHPAGLALLRSGEFGPVGPWSPAASAARRRPSEIYSARRRRYYGADLGTRNLSARYQLTTHIRDPPIPNTPGTVVAKYPDVPYVGQFCGPNDSIFCKFQGSGGNRG
jgi:WD repeat-containing protein 23